MSELHHTFDRRSFVSALLAAATMPRRSWLGSLAFDARVSRAPRPTLGMNHVPPTTESIALLKTLGITQVRSTLYWANHLDDRSFTEDEVPVPKGTRGGHTIADWWAIHTRAYLDAGLDVLMVVHTPPAGMTLAEGIKAMPPFVAARAKQFPGLHWQILNETDAEDAWSNGWLRAKDKKLTQRQRGEMYADLLAPVYDAIKKADPTATVVTAGIAGEPTEFYRGLVSRAPRKFDAVAVHVYGSPLVLPFRERSGAIRDVVGRTPLWCTETGFNSADDDEQTRQLSAIIADNDENRRFDRLYLYALTSDFAHGDNYGLVRPGGKRRGAAAMLARRMLSMSS
jgi:hypothetical protein